MKTASPSTIIIRTPALMHATMKKALSLLAVVTVFFTMVSWPKMAEASTTPPNVTESEVIVRLYN